MKILQISDIHWRGLTRHEEYTESFERLFKKIEELKPDLIINTGDSFHTKTQNITPEVIEKLGWMIKSLGDLAPTITILGNHDCVLSNLDRQDAISPIHNAVNHPNTYLIKKSGTYLNHSAFPEAYRDKVALHVYSPVDEHSWEDIKPIKGKINIGLFHGSVAGCETDLNFIMLEGAEREVSFFKGMDFVFLGDIHKQQFLGYRLDKNAEMKPWIGYPGSLIQQNFGELERKGFYVWDIRDVKDWDVLFYEHENRMPFVTTEWQGNVKDSLLLLEKNREGKGFFPGARYRFVTKEPILDVEKKQITAELKEYRDASEVQFDYDFVSSMEVVEAANKKIEKKDLRTDHQTLFDLYCDYVASHEKVYKFDDEFLKIAHNHIKSYLTRLSLEELDSTLRNTEWSLNSLSFSNTFRYGEDNIIDFKKLNGIVGILGPNRTGKSSIIGSLMYGLYNTSDRGPLKSAYIINRNKTWCSAKVDFNVDGIDYVSERKTTRAVPKKGAVTKKDEDKTNTALTLYKIDKKTRERVELNSISRDETDKELRKIIGTSQDFLMTAFASQGDINKFINEGATQRKVIINRFIDLDMFDKLYSYAKEDVGSLNEKTKEYNSVDWDKEIERASHETGLLQSSIDASEAKIAKLRQDLDKVNRTLELQEVSQVKIAKTKIKTLNEKIEKIESEIFENNQKSSEKSTNLKKISNEVAFLLEKRKEYDENLLEEKAKQVSQLREKIGIVSSTKEKQEFILESQKKSVLKLETVPCGDQFPTCRFIKDSHEDKAKIKEQEKIVWEITREADVLAEAYNDLLQENIAEQVKRLKSIDKDVADKEKLITSEKHQIDLINQKVLSLQETMIELRSEIDKNKEVLLKNKFIDEMNMDSLFAEQSSLGEEIKKEEFLIRDSLMKVGSLNHKIEQLNSQKEKYAKDIQNLKIFDSIQGAFSKTGIPAMVLKSQLPAINNEIHSVLSGVVDFKVYLETDINSNVLDVYLEDSSSKRVIELASGMEKTIASLAIRVALINVSNLPKPDILILDEAMVALDSEGVQKCTNLLVKLKKYFKTILLITHVEPIKEIVDKLITITDTGIESKVDV